MSVTPSTSSHYRVAICGAGPVGQALALLLCRRGVAAEEIVLIDGKTHQQAQHDARSIALSYGSQQILQSIAAWSAQATSIQQIHVSRRGQFGRCLISAHDYQLPALGYVSRYGDIIAPLQAQVIQTQITQHRPLQIQRLQESPDQVSLYSQTGELLHADIVVQAEGGLFGQDPQAEATSSQQQKNYQQTAIVAQVTSSKGAGHCAYERFTDEGPLALLPQEDAYALVWCVQHARAAELLALDEASFLSTLQHTFGERLGQFVRASARHHFPLGLQIQADDPRSKRIVRIGNAAQILHPVAGQGLNLGLRDAATLARLLAKHLTPAQLSPSTAEDISTVLQQFHQQRRADRTRTIRLTDYLARWFIRAPHAAGLQHLLGLGIGALDLIAPAKHALAEQMIFGQR